MVMIQILLHSSKTMHTSEAPVAPLGSPTLLDAAATLAALYMGLSVAQIAAIMKVSAVKAAEVRAVVKAWNAQPAAPIPAVDAFIGDIYSGLQVRSWAAVDRTYAQQHLLILSGLYGGLRACDGIMPYRLEMGYKLPDGSSLYAFWGDAIAKLLPSATTTIINLSAVEYTKAILPYVDLPVIAPKFLTVSPKTGEPTFVTVHAKIARGAFANWLVQKRINDPALLHEFRDLGYRFDAQASTPEQPVFVCDEFQGLGLSVRLLN